MWGVILFMIVVVGSAISSVGTHISAYFLPSFILALLITSYFLSLFFQPRIEAYRIMPPVINAGGHCHYKVVVHNTGKRIIRDLTIYEDALPYGLYPAIAHPDYKNAVDWLEPGKKAILTLVLRTPRRGTFELPPMIAGSSFPSGVLRSRIRTGRMNRLVIYPRFTRQAGFQIMAKRQFQPGGISLSSKVGDSNEFSSTREYRQGDRLRDVHWASSARTGKLIVKEYVEEYLVRVGLFVDTELKRFEKHKCFESRISLCAGIADMLSASDYIVDLIVSDEHLQHIQVGRGLELFDHLLELLSVIEGDRSVNFSAAAARLKEYTRKLSALVLFLKDWDDPRSAFVRQLKDLGIQVRVIIIRDQPTSIAIQEQDVSVYRTDELETVK
jgi:uncharacterized protein (DUF58 family)